LDHFFTSTNTTISVYCSIDDLLDGGVFTGEVTELTGSPSSGKTQLCFMTALTAAATTGTSVLYIDTLNSLSSLRLAEIYKKNPLFSQRSDLEQTLGKISCVHVYDIFQMIEVLETFLRDLGDEGSRNRLTKLVVIDSIASVISPVLAGGNLYLGTLFCFLSKVLFHNTIE
jgi:RAD51-like protein 3